MSLSIEKCNKVYFLDEKQANFYIQKLNKTSSRDLKPVRAYLCECCLNWHLTSIEAKEVKAIKYMQRQIDNLKASVLHLQKENERLNKRISTTEA